MIEAIVIAVAVALIVGLAAAYNDRECIRAEAKAKAEDDMGRLIYAGYYWDLYEFGVVDNFTGMRLRTPRDNGEWMNG